MLGLSTSLISKMILFIVTTTSFTAYIPQVIKLIKTKKSADISILSWLVWLGQYLLMLTYSVIYTTDVWLCLAYLIEFIACLIILLLVIRFKNNKS